MRHVREPEQIDTRKEAPVDNNTTYVAATRVGAAFPAVRSAWTGIDGLGEFGFTGAVVSQRQQPDNSRHACFSPSPASSASKAR